MDLRELQGKVDEWVRDHGGYWTDFELLARMTEELGEISSDLQRLRGLRPRRPECDLPSEIGDLLFTLAAFANVTNVDLESAIQATFTKYNQRDSDAWKSKHGHD
jgi:NTP pyrophosphatase (non-canonical NTP hydrolase)